MNKTKREITSRRGPTSGSKGGGGGRGGDNRAAAAASGRGGTGGGGGDAIVTTMARLPGAAVRWLLVTFALRPPVLTQGGHYSVVLLGATGDLARRHLWPALFSVYAQRASVPAPPPRGGGGGDDGGGWRRDTFSFHGAARAEPAEGRPAMFSALGPGRLRCPRRVAPALCGVLRHQFVMLTSYHRLSTEGDFLSLCRDFLSARAEEEGLVENGRLFYLSVPPHAYPGIVARLHRHCRPPQPGAWLRVLLEKPFGRDLASSRELAASLAGSLRHGELHLVDHYLAKPAVAAILPFRALNAASLTTVWGGPNVRRVEVTLMETHGVKGRMSFYDKYGVVRDVLQNHLTQVAALIAMEMPPARDPVAAAMLRAASLAELLPPDRSNAVIGQYEGYGEELAQELGLAGVAEGNGSRTATYAAVALRWSSPRWRSVPFVLASGKLSSRRRVALARLLLRRPRGAQVAFLIGGCGGGGGAHDPESESGAGSGAGAGSGHASALLVSRTLFRPRVDERLWREARHPEELGLGDDDLEPPLGGREGGAVAAAGRRIRWLGAPLDSFHVFVPRSRPVSGSGGDGASNRDPDNIGGDEEVELALEGSAHAVLLDAALRGRGAAFVSLGELEAAWGAWDPLLAQLQGVAPILYPPGTHPPLHPAAYGGDDGGDDADGGDGGDGGGDHGDDEFHKGGGIDAIDDDEDIGDGGGGFTKRDDDDDDDSGDADGNDHDGDDDGHDHDGDDGNDHDGNDHGGDDDFHKAERAHDKNDGDGYKSGEDQRDDDDDDGSDDGSDDDDGVNFITSDPFYDSIAKCLPDTNQKGALSLASPASRYL
ncbi:GDH/6PGL endoplasmic bifunctional protein-like isoform X2 [Petromyzon marinus]|uniref:GDH/6PGL endoplasmic bifunctional protein-like isoform X2 n=1 Tax=Petromyzon marinus TaxID=7757 RepID=A0AAJ7X7R2_PETMA|nr:GDH/6PGL endoplasmic bifunctional protein-like isoform X2 [Petromyzon marinus]